MMLPLSRRNYVKNVTRLAGFIRAHDIEIVHAHAARDYHLATFAVKRASQSRLVLEQVRNQNRTAVVSAWVTNEGTKIALKAAESEVSAADVALQGVRREAQGGQRTTIDVLNAQQDLTNARARQITSQRDRVIASYTLLSAVGHLDVKTLSLNTPDYLPELHYHQVRDAWHGLRTPSGQ